MALRSAERLNGTLVPCGPGWRGVGWPETPRVRLAALSEWLDDTLVASHLTAAWVWGAARSPGPQVQLSTRVGRRKPADVGAGIRVYELRYSEADTVRLGRYSVSAPSRTVLDLLYTPDAFTRVCRVACRLLLSRIDGGAAAIARHLQEHRRPHRLLAERRLVGLSPGGRH